MPKSSFIDFKAVKSALTMERVLEHYGLLDRFKRSGDNLSGPCPIHKGSNPTQFRVSISKNVWNCFSECKHGGNTLDFIARMENTTIHAAAMKAIAWFGIDPAAVAADSEEEADEPGETPKQTETPRPKPETAAKVETGGPNNPLKFRLDKLNREHGYIKERGLTLETVIDFGVGYCEKGMMAGRIAIPIHNPDGKVVAYAGRYAGEPSDENPKYKLPPGFRKSLELFNIDRAIKEPKEAPLVIVEGFFGCMMLHQHGCRKVVALMGSSMSAAQEEMIRKNTDSRSRIIVMLDEDEAGQAGRDDIACRLTKFCYVTVQTFEKPPAGKSHRRRISHDHRRWELKVYQGKRIGDEVLVTVDGVPLDPRFDSLTRNPYGFEWGYIGDGPAQLAFALLADCLGDEGKAVAWHDHYHCYVVAGLPDPDWTLTEESIREIIAEIDSR